MKILQTLKYVFIVVSVLAVATLFFMSEDAAVNLMLIWAYILMGISIAALIIMPAINLVKNPKGAMRSLSGLLVIVVLFGILYAVSSSEAVIGSDGTVFDNAMTLKLTDTGLYMAYFALAAAIVVALYGEIRNSLK